MNVETKVGAFILGGLALMGAAIFLLGDYTFEKRYPLYAKFSDVANLSKSAPVKLSGVEVGQIKEIELVDGGARVVMSVRDGVRIYRDAVFSVGSTGIIGSKYLQIDQGRADKGLLQPGDEVRGLDPVSIEKSLTKTLESLQAILNDLNTDSGRGTVTQNLKDTVANVREMTANLNDLLQTTKPDVQRAMARADEITEKLDKVLARTDQMMAGLATDKGAVGALLHDEKVKDDVKETIASVKEAAGTAKDVLGRLNQFRVWWNYDWRYEHSIRTSRADIGLKIAPRPGRYYYLGGSNLGNINDAPRPGADTDYAKKNLVDALLGFEGAWYDVGVGVIRSGGGARVSLTPLHKHPIGKRVSLVAQGYDFGRNRVIEGRTFDKPTYDVGVLARINRFFGVGARVEDIATIKRYQTWLKVTFEDNDVSYLFGLASFGAAGSRGRSKSGSN